MTTTTDFNGLFKQVYAGKIEKLIPSESHIQKLVPFSGKGLLLGNQYNQPVVVRAEQGFTYSRPNNGAPVIQPTSSMKTQNAVVDGYIILENCGIGYEAFYRADNANAFQSATSLVMQDAMESFSRRIEVALLYGNSPTGLGGLIAPTPGTATTTKLNFATGQFAGGLWTQMEGANLDVYNAGGTALNTVGAVTVTSIDVVNKTITITAAAADITAINALTTGYVRFYAAGTNGADEANGLDAIFLNTGVLYGIDASVYSLWKANVFSLAGGSLTFANVQKGIAVAAARGLDEDVTLFVNPLTWQNMSTEVNAFRMTDSSYSTATIKQGSQEIEFYSQTGKLTVIPHKYVKEGEAFAFPVDRAIRVGATDITFNIPGTDNGQVFIQDTTRMQATFRVYSQQNLLIERPASCLKFTNIVNV